MVSPDRPQFHGEQERQTLIDVAGLNLEGFSQQSIQVINLAVEGAKQLNHSYLEAAHLLLGIVRSPSARLITTSRLTEDALLQEMRRELLGAELRPERPISLVPRTTNILRIAYDLSDKLQQKHAQVTPMNILEAIRTDGESIGAGILRKYELQALSRVLEKEEDSAIRLGPESRTNIAMLNRHFRNKGSVYTPTMLARIRGLPRPIAVDFNGLFANTSSPLKVNPQAREAMEKLKTIGNVVIATSSQSWLSVCRFLREHKLWSDDIVLMTAQNYYNQEDEDLGIGYAEADIAEREAEEYIYLSRSQISPRAYRLIDLRTGLTLDKRVAPIFMKPFLVPMLDDAPAATATNPGMLGILVKSFVADPAKEWSEVYISESGVPLLEAVEQVRQYYSETAALENISLESISWEKLHEQTLALAEEFKRRRGIIYRNLGVLAKKRYPDREKTAPLSAYGSRVRALLKIVGLNPDTHPDLQITCKIYPIIDYDNPKVILHWEQANAKSIGRVEIDPRRWSIELGKSEEFACLGGAVGFAKHYLDWWGGPPRDILAAVSKIENLHPIDRLAILDELVRFMT